MKRTCRALVLACASVFCLVSPGRDTPILNGRLESDLNANGHTITNLPPGFFPEGGGVSSNDVRRMIRDLAPVPGNYETVSNRAMTALQTHQDISGKADKADTYTKAQTDARIVELAPVPDVQGAIGAFAATGTVHQAETASYATDADRANVATEAQVANRLGDSETGDLRTAAQIFSALDSIPPPADMTAATNYADYAANAVKTNLIKRLTDGNADDPIGVYMAENAMNATSAATADNAARADQAGRAGDATFAENLKAGGDVRSASEIFAAIDSGGGGEWVETNVTATLRFVTGYEHVTVPSGGTLTADVTDWPNGAALMVDLVPGGTYTVSGITMLGYQTWPTNRAEMVVFRSGVNVFANVILTY